MDKFINKDISALSGDFFTKLKKEWMLVTAGNKNSFNTMTASWGGIGILWNKNVSFVFIRKSRYTLEFVDSNEYYSLSFFNGKLMDKLLFCGRNSGRDTDKIKETGLIPVFDNKAPYFEQAETILVCRKLYKQEMTTENFIDKDLISEYYSDNDIHDIFVGEIVDVLVKK